MLAYAMCAAATAHALVALGDAWPSLKMQGGGTTTKLHIEISASERTSLKISLEGITCMEELQELVAEVRCHCLPPMHCMDACVHSETWDGYDERDVSTQHKYILAHTCLRQHVH